jgi:hypothetical protein
MEGEHLDTPERIIVSPAAGVFTAGEPIAGLITAGTTVGFVMAGGSSVPIVSPFDGHLIAVDAVEGERLTRHQRIAWLRAA